MVSRQYSLGGRHDSDNDEFACQWRGCSFSSARLSNLVAHLRSHTQEKVVSCPQCGLLFTARNKLRDHIIRQYQVGVSSYTLFISVSFRSCSRLQGRNFPMLLLPALLWFTKSYAGACQSSCKQTYLPHLQTYPSKQKRSVHLT